MTIGKNVLLARPHEFIVAKMRPFLERSDYRPTRLDGIDDLHPGAAILPCNSTSESHRRLGERNVFLFMNKDDIANSAAENILRRYFR